jgi:hypothetical protein
VSSSLPTALAALVLGTLQPLPSAAHHGTAAYDRSATLSLDAVVTRFDWENPHALVHFRGTDTRGVERAWTAETAGLVLLVRAGWNRQTLDPGVHCTIVGYAARNGSATMILERIELPDGRTLGNYLP